MTGPQLSVAFFLQMFFILAFCRLVGFVARRLGQPQVVGEMITGVLMGPSLFGLLAPEFQKVLFGSIVNERLGRLWFPAFDCL